MEGIKINGSGMDKERDGWARGGEEDVDEGCVKVLCEWCVCACAAMAMAAAAAAAAGCAWWLCWLLV